MFFPLVVLLIPSSAGASGNLERGDDLLAAQLEQQALELARVAERDELLLQGLFSQVTSSDISN